MQSVLGAVLGHELAAVVIEHGALIDRLEADLEAGSCQDDVMGPLMSESALLADKARTLVAQQGLPVACLEFLAQDDPNTTGLLSWCLALCKGRFLPLGWLSRHDSKIMFSCCLVTRRLGTDPATAVGLVHVLQRQGTGTDTLLFRALVMQAVCNLLKAESCRDAVEQELVKTHWDVEVLADLAARSHMSGPLSLLYLVLTRHPWSIPDVEPHLMVCLRYGPECVKAAANVLGLLAFRDPSLKQRLLDARVVALLSAQSHGLLRRFAWACRAARKSCVRTEASACWTAAACRASPSWPTTRAPQPSSCAWGSRTE